MSLSSLIKGMDPVFLIQAVEDVYSETDKPGREVLVQDRRFELPEIVQRVRDAWVERVGSLASSTVFPFSDDCVAMVWVRRRKLTSASKDALQKDLNGDVLFS